MKLLTKEELMSSLNFKLDLPYFVVTFHPVTLEKQTSEKHIKELLRALDGFKSYIIIFTKANADNDGRIINNLINEYVTKNSDRAVVYSSLGQLRYLSALKYSSMMIGNSSSGVFEMPFFNKPTINIGDRQKGRVFPKSVIQCEPNKKSIIAAIEKGLDDKLRKNINQKINIYGNGSAAKKMKKVLLTINLTKLIKKIFHDIETLKQSTNHPIIL